MRRIAVWNTAFLGDAVLTLPLLQSLRLRYPAAELDFYVRGGLEALFSSHPDISSVYPYYKKGKERGVGSALTLAKAVRARQYDLFVSAHTSLRSGTLALASNAPMRIGYDTPAYSRLFYTHRVARRFFELEEIERLQELLNPLGEGPRLAWPDLRLPSASVQAASVFFAALQGPVLGLHPGSVWATKRWKEEYFAEIAARAMREGANVILFAGPGEESIAQDVKLRVEKEQGLDLALLHDLSGALSLPDLAAYIARLSCYLTNDSGPMHLAWAQRVPVSAIFGPTVRALGFYPRGPASAVFEADVPCRPCGLHGPASCPLGHHACMVEVRPDVVWEDVRAKLWNSLTQEQ